MNLEGDKISTSRNWAIWVHEYLQDMPGREDELRYAMIKNMPEQKDSEFTWKGFQDANNNELVNNLANFVNRVIVLTNKYYDGQVPAFDESLEILGPADINELSYHDNEMLRLHDNVCDLRACIMKYDFRGALKKLMEISSNGNEILQYNEPWKTVKTDPEQVKVVMNLLLQYLNMMAVIIRPFMPFTSDKLVKLLNIPEIEEKGELNDLCMKLALGETLIEAGHKVGEPTHLFSRIDDEVIQAQMDKLLATKVATVAAGAAAVANATPPAAIKDTIQYDDFMKMDLRAATVLEAKKVKKADKLLELVIDLGFEQRTVVSGIAQHFSAEDVIGQRGTLLANLAPRTIKKVESKGMILMAENSDGSLKFIEPTEGVENGSSIS